MRFDYLIYTSRASNDLNEKKIAELIKISQSNNAKNDITGALVYNDQLFMQYIEGPRQALNWLFVNLINDNRHHEVLLRAYGSRATRLFENWSMKDLQTSIDRLLPVGWNRPVDVYLESLSAQETLEVFETLKKNFKQSVPE